MQATLEGWRNRMMAGIRSEVYVWPMAHVGAKRVGQNSSKSQGWGWTGWVVLFFLLVEKIVVLEKKRMLGKPPQKKTKDTWKCWSIFVPRSWPPNSKDATFFVPWLIFGAPLTDNKNTLHQQESSRNTWQQSLEICFWVLVYLFWALQAPKIGEDEPISTSISPRKLGKMNPFWLIFFRWVETTNWI